MKCQKCKETCLHRPARDGEKDTRCFDSHFQRHLDADNTRCCICAYSHLIGILRNLCPRCQERVKCRQFKKTFLSNKCVFCKRKEEDHYSEQDIQQRMTAMGFGVPVDSPQQAGGATSAAAPGGGGGGAASAAASSSSTVAKAPSPPQGGGGVGGGDNHNNNSNNVNNHGGGDASSGKGGGGDGMSVASGSSRASDPSSLRGGGVLGADPSMTPRNQGGVHQPWAQHNQQQHGAAPPPADVITAGLPTAAAAAAVAPAAQAGVGGQGRDLLLERPQWEIQPHELMISSHKLGTGNFGAVWRGLFNGAVVAIKRPFAQQPKPQDLQTIRREVAMLNQIRHPNCVAFYGACLVPNMIAIVTEYVQRGNLHDLIARKRLPPALRIRMARDTASGMLYLHRRGIIHRDLKSLNLLVAEDYTVRVADFGLAVLKNNGPTQMVGTPSWMAPELFRNSPCDERSDVYAFGMVMWELLTCAKPHLGFETKGVQQFVLSGHRPLVPNPLPDGFTFEFWTLLQASWDQDPSNRPLFHDILPQLEQMLHVASQDHHATGGVRILPQHNKQHDTNSHLPRVIPNLSQSLSRPGGLPALNSLSEPLTTQLPSSSQAPPSAGQAPGGNAAGAAALPATGPAPQTQQQQQQAQGGATAQQAGGGPGQGGLGQAQQQPQQAQSQQQQPPQPQTQQQQPPQPQTQQQPQQQQQAQQPTSLQQLQQQQHQVQGVYQYHSNTFQQQPQYIPAPAPVGMGIMQQQRRPSGLPVAPGVMYGGAPQQMGGMGMQGVPVMAAGGPRIR